MTADIGLTKPVAISRTGAIASAPVMVVRPMPTITVVMPAFDEADRIAQTIHSLARYRAGGAPIGPIIIADDGSSDATIQVAESAARDAEITIEILAMRHRGKALTVRTAMLDVATRTGTEYLMMLDADDELGIDQLDGVAWSTDPRTIYIGRRVKDVGQRPTPIRRAMSTAMRTASRLLLGIRFPDTQCGFKLFPTNLAADLFAQQRSSSWTFDAELLFIADRVSGLPIQEVPVVWRPRGTSHVRPLDVVISGLTMFATAGRRASGAYRPVRSATPGS
jgi:hypothetical protein